MRYNTRKATIPSGGGSMKLLILSPKGGAAQKSFRPSTGWRDRHPTRPRLRTVTAHWCI